MKKYIDLKQTILKTDLNETYREKIRGFLSFKLPYGFQLLKYGTTLEFDAMDFIDTEFVDRLFKVFNSI